MVGNSGGSGSALVAAPPPPTPPPAVCSGRTRNGFCSTHGAPVTGTTTSGDQQCVCDCDQGWKGGNCQSECKNRICGAGTHRAGSCTDSVDGFFCAGCPSGTYTSVWSSKTSCTRQAVTHCVRGYKLTNYGSKTSAQSCVACSEGTYQDNNSYAGNVCLNQPWQPCAKGFEYSNLDSTTAAMRCTACPQGKTTSGTIKSERCFDLNCTCQASMRSSSKRGLRPVV